MTIKELKKLLNAFPEEMEVKILMSDDFYQISKATIVDESFDGGKNVVALCSDEEV